MAGDIGYLISPVTIGGLAQAASFPAAFLVGAVPAAAVLLASLRLPKGLPSQHREPIPEPAALG
jgi:hypothetical protein